MLRYFISFYFIKVIVNAIVFLVSFSMSLLVVYREATDLYMLILDLAAC
jgi:hypothetical protein